MFIVDVIYEKNIICKKHNFGFTQLYTWKSIAWTIFCSLIVLLPKLDSITLGEKCGKWKQKQKKDHINIDAYKEKAYFPFKWPFFVVHSCFTS